MQCRIGCCDLYWFSLLYFYVVLLWHYGALVLVWVLSDRIGWKELSNSITLWYNKGICHVDDFDSSTGLPVSYFYGRGKKNASHMQVPIEIGVCL